MFVYICGLDRLLNYDENNLEIRYGQLTIIASQFKWNYGKMKNALDNEIEKFKLKFSWIDNENREMIRILQHKQEVLERVKNKCKTGMQKYYKCVNQF